MSNNSDDDVDPGEAALWREAGTLVELGTLMARWLEGDLRFQPGYAGPAPDDETASLVPVLAALNRKGYVTDFSQPGEVDGEWVQRAAVSGFCSEGTAQHIYDAVLETDLIPLVWEPIPVSHLYQLCVSREGRRQNTWAGSPIDLENIEHCYAGELGQAGLRALMEAFQVTVVDPHWGRDELLWSTLGDVV